MLYPYRVFAVIFFLAGLCVFAAQARAGDEEGLFREIIKEHAKIGSIDAEITQIIRTGEAGKEIFRGRYRADSLGRFRIDYTAPSAQIVINDGKRFFWYYPPEKLLYEIERKEKPAAQGGINPMKEFAGEFEKRFTVSREGKRLYGFFRTAECFRVRDGKTGVVLEIKADPERKLILEKTVRDARGREIMKELYEEYGPAGGTYFPSRVTVSTLTARGVTVNLTRYSHIVLNTPIRSSVFEIAVPGNVARRKLYQ